MKPVAFFTAVGLLAGCPVVMQVQAPDPTLVGTVAPEFTLTDEFGKEVSLGDYRGKLVLLNFWATWCSGCVEEMPQMMELNMSLADRPFQMLAVSVDTSWAPVLDFFEGNDVHVPTLLDPGQHTRQEYRVFAFPETFLIDGDGQIVRKYIGWQDWTRPEIRRDFEEYLGKLESAS